MKGSTAHSYIIKLTSPILSISLIIFIMSEHMLITPPFETKRLIDKTAEFIAQNASYEQMILKSESGNPKFSFLHPDD